MYTLVKQKKESLGPTVGSGDGSGCHNKKKTLLRVVMCLVDGVAVLVLLGVVIPCGRSSHLVLSWFPFVRVAISSCTK